jgi:TPR repeat protein
MKTENENLKKARRFYLQALKLMGNDKFDTEIIKKKLDQSIVLGAVKLGSASACFDLASCLERGDGIEKDKQKAFELYLEAALRDDQDSYREVARCYWHGIGIRKNRVVAKLWGNRFVS